MIGLTIILSILLILFLVIFGIVDAAGIPTFLIFLVLKLCNVIEWDWIWVCMPLIIWGACLALTVLICFFSGFTHED